MLENVKRRHLKLPGRGVEIALLDWGGDGPLALLHHANGFCAATWDGVARLLTPDFRVIAMDGRGHGDSSRPEGAEAYAWAEFGADVVAVSRALSDEMAAPMVLGVGNSLGGTAVMLAEAAEPGLFERLLLVDPVLLPAPSEGHAAPAPGNATRLIESTLRRRAVFPDRETARATWATKPLFADWTPSALDLYVNEGLAARPDGQVELKCTPNVEASVFANTRESGVWKLAECLKLPVSMLWARDGDFPRPVFERYADLLSDVTLADLACGHLAPMERPDLVADAVFDFTGTARRDQRSSG